MLQYMAAAIFEDSLLQGLASQLNQGEHEGAQGQCAKAGPQRKLGRAQRAPLQRISRLGRCEVPAHAHVSSDLVRILELQDALLLDCQFCVKGLSRSTCHMKISTFTLESLTTSLPVAA